MQNTYQALRKRAIVRSLRLTRDRKSKLYSLACATGTILADQATLDAIATYINAVQELPAKGQRRRGAVEIPPAAPNYDSHKFTAGRLAAPFKSMAEKFEGLTHALRVNKTSAA